MDEERLAAILTRNLDIKSLPKFGQTANDDITDFLLQLDHILIFYHLADEQKARIFPLVLQGRAYTFYLTRPDETKANYQQMREALLAEFNAPEVQYQKRQQLHELKQNEQSIHDYLSKVEKLSQHLDVANQTKLDIMIAGLDPQYRRFIQMEQPATYEDATRKLLLKESISPPEDKKLLENVLETIQTIKNNQENGGIGHSNNLHTNHNPRNYRSCYYCGKPGHMMKECRWRMADENQYTQYDEMTNKKNVTTRIKKEENF